MLRITTTRRRGRVLLTIEGRLAGASISALQDCWRELRANSPSVAFSVDLCAVSFIDEAGKVLLKDIHHQGGELVANGCLNQAIVREIVEGEEMSSQKRRTRGRKGSHFFYYGFLLFALVAPGALRAQQPPGASPDGTLRLTLDQAVGLALKQNTSARIAVLSAAQSEEQKNIARAALLPQVQLGANDSVQRLNIQAGLGIVIPIPGFSQHAGPFQVFNAGPSFGAPIFDLTLWRRYQAARFTADAARASSLSTREQVILLVVSQYIGTLRATADVRASESRVELAQALFDQAADLQKAGVGTGIDTLRANVELQNEKQRLIVAQATQETSLFALSRLLNLDPRQRVELADSLAFFDTPQPDVDASIDQALAGRPEWKALESQVRAAQKSRGAVGAERFPSLRFDGDWAYTGLSVNSGIPTYKYQAGVNLPIFTGGRIHAEIVNADLEIKKLRQQQADLRNEIALDVKTALINLRSARNEVEVANLGVKLATDEVDQARDRFKAGVANNIEVISAQDSLARANDNQIAALFRFNQARADFARAVGQMEKLYAK